MKTSQNGYEAMQSCTHSPQDDFESFQAKRVNRNGEVSILTYIIFEEFLASEVSR